LASPAKDKHLFASEVENVSHASHASSSHASSSHAPHASPYASPLVYKDVEHIVWHPARKAGGMGLMRYKKSPVVFGVLTNDSTLAHSPPKKKLCVDHKTSPNFHRSEYEHAYELSFDDIPEPPKVKRTALIE
jgi:hypothetical protein